MRMLARAADASLTGSKQSLRLTDGTPPAFLKHQKLQPSVASRQLSSAASITTSTKCARTLIWCLNRYYSNSLKIAMHCCDLWNLS